MKEELKATLSDLYRTIKYNEAEEHKELLLDRITQAKKKLDTINTYTPLSEKVPTVEEVGEYVLVYCEKWVNKVPQVKKTILLDTEIYLNNKHIIHWAKLPEKH